MNRFAELLDRLAYEPGRNNKLKLITAYFREVEDPDRGYALAALTGALSFKHAKSGLIRDLIAARTDPTLFALSYDYVGDLSETVALMWPKAPPRARSTPSPACGGGPGWGLSPRVAPRREPPPASHLRCDATSPASGRGVASQPLEPDFVSPQNDNTLACFT
jgi:DNA ligase-1